MQQIPVAIGMLVCDLVIIEEESKNVTPVNCWRRRSMRAYPTDPQRVTVLAFLTDGLGETSLEVVIHNLDNWDVIHRHRARARFDNPLQEFRCVFRLRDVTFPVSGEYQVSLYADGDVISQRRISLAEVHS